MGEDEDRWFRDDSFRRDDAERDRRMEDERRSALEQERIATEMHERLALERRRAEDDARRRLQEEDTEREAEEERGRERREAWRRENGESLANEGLPGNEPVEIPPFVFDPDVRGPEPQPDPVSVAQPPGNVRDPDGPHPRPVVPNPGTGNADSVGGGGIVIDISAAATGWNPAPEPAIQPFRVDVEAARLPTDPPARYYDGMVAAQGTDVLRQGVPTEPPLTGAPHQRSVEMLDQIINQFAPGTNRRYRDPNKTLCNIFVWDVTRALGAEIPHYIDVKTGDILSRDEVLNRLKAEGLAGKLDKASMAQAGMDEVGATGALDWLVTHGAVNGWREISDPAEAQRLADAGRPVVPVYGNRKGGHGHIAILRPQTESRRAHRVNGKIDPVIANVGGNGGRNNDLESTVSKSFGDLPVRYFAHD